MSKYQEQSLDEDVVFLPVNEYSPKFLHCEKERQAVERLLSAGPEAFYSSISTEHSSCFLSSEEVSQITSWAQENRLAKVQVQKEENGVESSSDMEDVCSTYFPCQSDIPPPDLELGWPERNPWIQIGDIKVHTSPPAEGELPVREVIRWHLQMASQVIGVVTDSLTDSAIIGDLHNAASRGVPVYIIFNQRTIQDSLTLGRLRHPNMRVRHLGGRTFCSRAGKTVVGEMKDRFLLLDSEIVIHGSYSLTWTDAHLHRQLITVISGPVVDTFDREFRTLYAASFPVPDTWRVAGSHVNTRHHQTDFSDVPFQKQLSLEPEIPNPPSPPVDSNLDWEAMGVFPRDCCFPDSLLGQHEDIATKEMSLQNNMPIDKNTPSIDNFTRNGNQFLDERRICENTSSVTDHVLYKSATFNNTQPSPTNPATQESTTRVEHVLEKAFSRQTSTVKNTTLDGDKATELMHNKVSLSSAGRKEHLRWEPILKEESSTSPKVEITPSRKPIILRVLQSESLSDITKRLQTKPSTSGLLECGLNAAVPEVSQSVMELNIQKTDTNYDERGIPRPTFTSFDSTHVTPASALMKRRNSGSKSSFLRTPKNFLPRERPLSSSYTLSLDWRKSLTHSEEAQE